MDKITVTITDRKRAVIFESIFGSATVQICSPIPERVNLPGRPCELIYKLDLTTITPTQREQLVAYLAGQFDLPADQVEADLIIQGVPILADRCIVEVTPDGEGGSHESK